MLPISAMPSAPPSSALVSDSAEAAPARSGGADPRMMSVVNAATGVSPREKTICPSDERRERGRGSAGLREDDEAHSGHEHSARDHVGWRVSPHDRGRHGRSCDERKRCRQSPEPGAQGRHSEHGLEVLRDEQESRECRQETEEVHCEGRAERWNAKQPEIDQGIGQASLPPQERNADCDASGN